MPPLQWKPPPWPPLPLLPLLGLPMQWCRTMQNLVPTWCKHGAIMVRKAYEKGSQGQGLLGAATLALQGPLSRGTFRGVFVACSGLALRAFPRAFVWGS